MDRDIQRWADILHEHEQEILLAEMARVGDMTPALEIYVRSHEGGNIPHFHIWDKVTQGQKFHTCVEIKSPKYFHHTRKEDILNMKQKRLLVEFLKAKPKKLRKYDTNWEVVIDMWNNGDSEMSVVEDLEMPNYLEL